MSFLRLGYKRHCCFQLGWYSLSLSLSSSHSSHLLWGKLVATSGSSPMERPMQEGTQVSCQQSLRVRLELALLDQGSNEPVEDWMVVAGIQGWEPRW